MSLPKAPTVAQVQLQEVVEELAQTLRWLEENTRAVPGEAAAVAESWHNVDLALETLGQPPAMARERMPRPGGES